jgi:hypothetical protein
MLPIVVCGNENVVNTAIPTGEDTFTLKVGDSKQISKSSYETYFTVTNEDHSDCTELTYSIFTGSSCNTADSLSRFTFDSSSNIIFDTASSYS